MKTKFTKLISSLLVAALLLSMTTVFAFAAENDTANNDDLTVLLNRNFEEGWDFNNGLGAIADNAGIAAGVQEAELVNETLLTGGINNFFEIRSLAAGSQQPYFMLSVGGMASTADCGGLVFEFDINSRDGIDVAASAIYTRVGGTVNGTNPDKTLLSYTADGYISSGGVKLVELTKNWAHITMQFDYTHYKEGYVTVTVSCAETGKVGTVKLEHADPFPAFFRVKGPAKDSVGNSVGFDNIKLYIGTDKTTELPKDNYGTLVNSSLPKSYDTSGGATGDGTVVEKSITDCINDGLAMKVGVNYALSAGTKINLFDGTYGAPKKIDGVIYLPLAPLLEHMKLNPEWHSGNKGVDIPTSTGSTLLAVGREDAVVDGKVVALTAAPGFLYNSDKSEGYLAIAMDDVEKLFPGWYITYDDMGFILLGERDNLMTREADLDKMLTIMKKFVFDYPSEEKVLEDMIEGTNNFDHPYLYANAEYFAYLREIYSNTYTDTTSDEYRLKEMLIYWVNQGEKAYRTYAKVDADDNYMKAFAPKGVTKVNMGEGDYIRVASPIVSSVGYYKYVGEGNGNYRADSYNYPISKYATHNLDPNDNDLTDSDGGFLDWVNNVCPICNNGREHAGYDCIGSRVDDSPSQAGSAMNIAFAYQITGNLDYARAAYDILDVVGNQEHWGPAHMLNAAETAGAFATALDWVWDGIEILRERGEVDYRGQAYDTNKLLLHLWDHGTSEAYRISILSLPTFYLRVNNDVYNATGETTYMTSGPYHDDRNNWGNVCQSNMIMAAMVVMSMEGAPQDQSELYTPERGSAPGNTYNGLTYQEIAAKIMSYHLWSMPTYSFGQYAPDGAYVEGPSYWGYGTNELLMLLAAMYPITGTDYGLLDSAGYDQTFYFAASVETLLYKNASGAGTYYDINFNDCGAGGMALDYFFIAGIVLEDPVLIELRHMHIDAQDAPSLCDIFHYRSRYMSVGTELPLDYTSTSLDLFTTRSSWEEKSIFAGIIGGMASVNHGHMDTCNWVYYSEGIPWIIDMGSESYNVYTDTDYAKMRYRYYKLSAEGHNTLIMTSKQAFLPYGMNISNKFSAHFIPVNEAGDIMYSDEYGSFVKYDMTDAYQGGYNNSGGLMPGVTAKQVKNYAKSASRGMLFTNSRSTVVIQDEVILNGVESMKWYAHIQNRTVTFSEDKRTAYIVPKTTDVSQNVLRLTILSDDPTLDFELRDTVNYYDLSAPENPYPVLDINSHLQYGGDAQKSRDSWRKLVINCDGITYLNLAVVIEVIDRDAYDNDLMPPVGYEFVTMEKWTTAPKSDVSVDTNVSTDPDVVYRGSSDFRLVNVVNYTLDLQLLVQQGTAFTSEIAKTYSLITSTEWTLSTAGGADKVGGYGSFYANAIAELRTYEEMYNSYRDTLNAVLEKSYMAASNLNR